MWKKTLGFILIGILIAVVFTLTDTYSLFQSSHDGYGDVMAASREDIVSSMEIYYHNDVPILRLKEGDKINYSPIVFFSIEGDAKDYALHVNSIELEGIVEIPIIPNVNLPQALSLIMSSRNEVTGKLKIKHLNEFIDDTLEFSFSKDYLLSRYFCDKGLKIYDMNYLSKNEKEELVNLVEDTLLYAKRYLEWDVVQWEEENNWISEIDIIHDQALLIDIIAPGLIEYNEKLYQLFEVITKELENEIEKNNTLSRENEELIDTIEKLRDEKEGLYSHIYDLELEIEELMDRLNKGTVLEPEKPEEPKVQEMLEETGAL